MNRGCRWTWLRVLSLVLHSHAERCEGKPLARRDQSRDGQTGAAARHCPHTRRSPTFQQARHLISSGHLSHAPHPPGPWRSLRPGPALGPAVCWALQRLQCVLVWVAALLQTTSSLIQSKHGPARAGRPEPVSRCCLTEQVWRRLRCITKATPRPHAFLSFIFSPLPCTCLVFILFSPSAAVLLNPASRCHPDVCF